MESFNRSAAILPLFDEYLNIIAAVEGRLEFCEIGRANGILLIYSVSNCDSFWIVLLDEFICDLSEGYSTFISIYSKARNRSALCFVKNQVGIKETLSKFP